MKSVYSFKVTIAAPLASSVISALNPRWGSGSSRRVRGGGRGARCKIKRIVGLKVLTQKDVDQFIERGWCAVPGCFTRAAAQEKVDRWTEGQGFTRSTGN